MAIPFMAYTESVSLRFCIRKRGPERMEKLTKSISTEDMAAALLALTVGTQDADGQRSLKEEMGEIVADGLTPDVVQIELALLKFSVIYIALSRYEDLRRLHGSKLDELLRLYVAQFKERTASMDPIHEEIFQRLSEIRLAAYNKAFDAWFAAHNNGRGQEQTFTIGETFFHFCGVQDHNPINLFLIGHKFNTTLAAVNKELRSCNLT